MNIEKSLNFSEENKELSDDKLIEPLTHFLSEVFRKQDNADRDMSKDYDFFNDFHISNGPNSALKLIKEGKAKIDKINLERQEGKLIKIEVFIDTENSGYNMTIIQLMNKALQDFLRKNNLETN